MPVEKFQPHTCPTCGQSAEYLVPVDHGTVVILKAIAKRIGMKQINVVHPRKEMETTNKMDELNLINAGLLTSNMVGNLSRPRMHGLIAKFKSPETEVTAGNYCLTKKGAQFLRGEIAIPKYAIRSKIEGKTNGYFEPDSLLVHIDDFNTPEPGGFWEGIDYEITDGRVFTQLPEHV